jgi:hypothetical protein
VDDVIHTRFMDHAWPHGVGPTHEDMLSTHRASLGPIDALRPEDFPPIEKLSP